MLSNITFAFDFAFAIRLDFNMKKSATANATPVKNPITAPIIFPIPGKSEPTENPVKVRLPIVNNALPKSFPENFDI